MLTHVLWGSVCAILAAVAWHLKAANSALSSKLETARLEAETLQTQLAEAVERLAQLDTSIRDGMFQKAVEGLVALGVPGLVLLVAVSVSGYAGAAAITTALAALGGPAGMFGGIGVLLLLVLVSKVLAQYGLPRMAQAVVRGLMAKGESPESIKTKLDRIPKWVILAELRRKIDETLNAATQTAAA